MYWPGLRELISLLLFALSLVSAAGAARRIGRLPMALALPVGLALVVCWDTLALNLLSTFGGVNAATLAVASLAGSAVALKIGRPWRIDWTKDFGELKSTLRFAGRALRLKGPSWALLPLVVMLSFVAYTYPPSNW